jgi:arsenate reductase-like glutaredoxin family protein
MQEYLAKAGVETKTEVNARKEKYQQEEALALLEKAQQLHVAKGKKRVSVNLKQDEIDDEALLKLVLGPTGNLRAPTLLIGKTMVVGFNQELLDELF